jgi:cytochrome b subunit of formate dehydrogenase
MMLHATCAPVFAVCMAALAVMWAGRCCFEDSDCPVTRKLVQWLTGNEDSAEKGACKPGVGQKVFFWLLIALSLPLILSIVVSMFPFVGTHWQEYLLVVHRRVAAAFVVCGVIHAILLIKSRKK